MAGAGGFFSGISVTIVSVVMIIVAIEAAFSSAERVTSRDRARPIRRMERYGSRPRAARTSSSL